MKITENILRKMIQEELLKEQETQFVYDQPTDAGYLSPDFTLNKIQNPKVNQAAANITIAKLLDEAIIPVLEKAMQQAWYTKQGVQPAGSNKRFIWNENSVNQFRKIWTQNLTTVVAQYSNNPNQLAQQALNVTLSDMKSTIWGDAITPQIEQEALAAIQNVVKKELFKKYR